MLMKLLKYDFMAVSRLLCPIYGVMILVSILVGVGIVMENEVLLVTSILAYVIMIFAVLICTFLRIIDRYSTALLKDEGYFTHALPIPTWLHITEKILSGTIWTFLSYLVIGVSVLTFFLLDPDEISDAFDVVYNIYVDYTPWGIAGSILTTFVAIISFLAIIYASVTVGNLWKKHSTLGAFLAFLVINTVKNLIDGIVQVSMFGEFHSVSFGVYVDAAFDMSDDIGRIIGMQLLSSGIVIAACMALICWIMTYHLGLD